MQCGRREKLELTEMNMIDWLPLVHGIYTSGSYSRGRRAFHINQIFRCRQREQQLAQEVRDAATSTGPDH